MRLIDADALIEDLRTQFRDARKILKNPESTELHREMTHIRMGRLVSTVVSISTAQTVDAVPVVRCNGCKHYNGLLYTLCPRSGMNVIDDEEDYCCRAERAEE